MTLLRILRLCMWHMHVADSFGTCLHTLATRRAAFNTMGYVYALVATKLIVAHMVRLLLRLA